MDFDLTQLIGIGGGGAIGGMIVQALIHRFFARSDKAIEKISEIDKEVAVLKNELQRAQKDINGLGRKVAELEE